MKRWSLLLLLPVLWLGCSQRGLSNAELSEAVKAQKETLDVCYDTALAEKPDRRTLNGEAFLVIEPSGKVSSVAVQGELVLPGLQDCLHGALSGWTFPESGAKTTTSLPLVFKPEFVKAGQAPRLPAAP